MAAIIGVILYVTVLIGGVAVTTSSTPTGTKTGGIVIVDTDENN